MVKIALLLTVGLLNIVLALVVLIRDHRKLANAAFFMLALTCAAWTLGIAAFLLTDDLRLALNWAKFYYFVPLLLVATAVMVADIFPAGNTIDRKKLALLGFGLLALSVPMVAVDGFMITGIATHDWGKAITLNKVHYLLYTVYIVAGFSWMIRTLHRKLRTERGVYRVQAKVFFYGTLLSAIFGTLFNLFLPWFGAYQFVWVGPLAASIYLSTTLYSIVKHKLFDIRLIVARSLGYLLALLVLSALYGATVFTAVNLVLQGEMAPATERLVSAGVAVVLALTFRPIKLFFDRITSRLFYRDAYDTQTLIDRLNHVLISTIEIEKLLGGTARLLQDTLKAGYCTFVILATPKAHQQIVGSTPRHMEPRELSTILELAAQAESKVVIADYLDSAKDKHLLLALQASDVAMVGRISADNGQGSVLGYLLLGPKKSGNPYNRQDAKAVEVVVNELVIAIQNALRFQEIESFNITLQQKVDEATRKLRRSNDKLRKLDETKDDFISMASHQLRTPLTSVKGYISMVLDGDAGKISALQRKLLTQSFISSQRMVYLISDLLNVSRLKTGKFVIEPVPTNLARVIQEEVEQLTETVKGRNLTLTYHKPEHFPTLMLDETKLRQVIMNFVDNAVYYTPAGGHIEIILADKPNSIEFSVVDDGIGVPRGDQHHLFSKFFRAHNARRSRPDGTGLGLFMARKVIASQGGAIIFKSKEGHGSTFGFTFAKSKLLPADKARPGTSPAVRA